MGIAGIIFAVLGLALSIIPAIGWILTTTCLVTGTSLSTIGLIQKRKFSQWDRTAIAGIITNVVVLVIIILWIYFFVDRGLNFWDAGFDPE